MTALPPSPSSPTELRILTLNLWVNEAPKRCFEQVAHVKEVKPDVVCLQECFSMKVVRVFRDAFERDYEVIRFKNRLSFGSTIFILIVAIIIFLPFFVIFCIIELIVSGFPIWLALVIAACISLFLTTALLCMNKLGTTDFLLGNKTGTMMLVKRSLITGIQSEATLFKEWKADYLNWLRPRGFLCARGFLPSQGEATTEKIPFMIMTSHLDQVIEQPEGKGRMAQAKEMLTRVEGFEGLVVMAADWNFTPSDNPGGTRCGTYEHIRNEMNDAWNGQSDLGATWDQVENPLAVSKTNDMAYQNAEALRWRCDIIFWKNTSKKKIECSSCEVLFRPPHLVSDHYGVLATFNL